MRPGDDQGSSDVFQFEQIIPRVADLGTQIPSSYSVLCGEDLHVPFSLLIMQCREHFVLINDSLFLLKAQALFLRPNLITHLQYVLMLIDTLQSCMPGSDSENKPYLKSLYMKLPKGWRQEENTYFTTM